MPHVKQRANAFLILTVLAVFFLIAVLIILMTQPARASDVSLPEGVSCATIRSLVAEHGKVTALAWAIRQGYSWPQIREAKKCLKP